MRHNGAPLSDELIAAIVSEVKHGGERYTTIARRYGVSHQTVRKYALRAGVQRDPRPPGSRPEIPCLGCGRPCRSVYGLCRNCKSDHLAEPEPVIGDTAALTGGQWVPNGRGTLVWQSEYEEAS